jgi:hypothetical protein
VLLGHVHRNEALRLIARRAREVAEADLVLVLLYDDPAAQFTVEVVDVARHAAATTVRVSVRAADGQVVVQVEDDSVGTDPGQARGGLASFGNAPTTSAAHSTSARQPVRGRSSSGGCR